ncbi:MAG: Holliday junction resolvase RuvX [Holosporales bacterium]|jgi:putative Holliday junction resolvase|nr:Holliday junction resolvase RuvX [Holosporales bacterium]
MPSLPADEFQALLSSSQGPIAGIDVGERRTGLALSDMNRCVALPWQSLHHDSLMKGVAPIASLMMERGVAGIVVGWPIETSGNIGAQCKKVLRFADALFEQTSKAFFLWDERLSTAVVIRHLKETHVSYRKYEQRIDKEVAAHLLQGALDFFKSFSVESAKKAP